VDRSWENRSQTHDVEIGAEAAQFPEKEYINGIAVAVHHLINIYAMIKWVYSPRPLYTANERMKGG
jgi:hypothetical protein